MKEIIAQLDKDKFKNIDLFDETELHFDTTNGLHIQIRKHKNWYVIPYLYSAPQFLKLPLSIRSEYLLTSSCIDAINTIFEKQQESIA